MNHKIFNCKLNNKMNQNSLYIIHTNFNQDARHSNQVKGRYFSISYSNKHTLDKFKHKTKHFYLKILRLEMR